MPLYGLIARVWDLFFVSPQITFESLSMGVEEFHWYFVELGTYVEEPLGTSDRYDAIVSQAMTNQMTPGGRKAPPKIEPMVDSYDSDECAIEDDWEDLDEKEALPDVVEAVEYHAVENDEKDGQTGDMEELLVFEFDSFEDDTPQPWTYADQSSWCLIPRGKKFDSSYTVTRKQPSRESHPDTQMAILEPESESKDSCSGERIECQSQGHAQLALHDELCFYKGRFDAPLLTGEPLCKDRLSRQCDSSGIRCQSWVNLFEGFGRSTF